METMKTRKSKFLVMLIVFMMLFSNFGYTIAVIATSDEFEIITKGFFQKDEVKFNAYFEDENGNKTTEITENVNNKPKLVIEVLPQVDGYLKSGSIKAVSSDDDNINFKFASVTENLLSDRRSDSEKNLSDALVDKNTDKEEPSDKDVSENTVVDNPSDETPVPENSTNENPVTGNPADVNGNNADGNTEPENPVDGKEGSVFVDAIGDNTKEENTNPLADVLGSQGSVANATETNTVDTNSTEINNTATDENGTNPFLNALGNTTGNNPLTQPVGPTEPEAPVEKPSEQEPETPAENNNPSEDDLVNEDAIIEEKTEASRLDEEMKNAILDIKLASENEISLSNIINDTKIEIELEYNQGEKFNVADLLKNIKLQMSGTYINRDLEEVKVGKEEEITVGWEYTKDINLESEYTKISPFVLEDVKGTIVENKITVTREIQDEKYLPVKSTRLEIVVPKINDKNPIAVDVLSTRLMATRGEDSGYVKFNSENWKYDEANGLINVFVENDNNVYSKGSDEYVIIYRYEDYVESENANLQRNVRATVTEYSGVTNNNLVKEIKDGQEVKVDVGELITYSVGTNEDTINKFKIYANYNSDIALYETLYTTQVNVNILTSDVLQQLKLDCTKEVYKDSNGVEFEAKGIEYKQISFNYAEISALLADGGDIVITNALNETIHTLNKDNITNEESCTVNLNGANGIIIYANNVTKNGTLNFELTKAIKKCNYDKTIFKNISKIESRVSGEVKYLNIEDRIPLQTIAVAKDFEESSTSATLSVSRSLLSTINSNDNIELKIQLNNDKEGSDLYINPYFEIVFPKYVTAVGIESINLLNECGLRVADFQTFTENDLVKLKIELSGTQTIFSENSNTNGTNIIINANIAVDNYAPAKEDQIKLYYCNEGVATYQSQTNWSIGKAVPSGILKTTNGFDVEVIKYQAPTGLIAINGIANYDGNLSEVRSVKQGTVAKQVPINAPARIATMELLALNNTENVCSDITLLGRVPYKGIKDVISGEDLGVTTDAKMIDQLKSDVQNTNTAEIYYSTNENADRDLKKPENGWTTTVEDLSTVKSYMIVVKGDVEAGSVLRYTYDFEIPANLPYEARITGSFGAYYNNNKEEAVVFESSSADSVVLETGIGPKIEAKMSVDIGDGAEVLEGSLLNYSVEVTNTGSVPAEGVTVNVQKPGYTNFTEYRNPLVNEYIAYYYKSDSELNFNIDAIAPGESQKVDFMVRVSTPLGDIATREEIEKDEEENKDNYAEEENIEEEYIEDDNDEDDDTNKSENDNTQKDYIISATALVKVNNLGMDIETNKTNNKITKANFETEVMGNFSTSSYVENVLPYSYKIKNISGKNLENVEFICKLPKELRYESSSVKIGEEEISTNHNNNEISFTIENLEKNSSISFECSAKAIFGTNENITPELIMKYENTEEKALPLYTKIKGTVLETEIINQEPNDTILEGKSLIQTIRLSNIGEYSAKNLTILFDISNNLEEVNVRYTGSVSNSAKVTDNKASILINELAPGKYIDIIISGRATTYREEGQEIINNINVRTPDIEISNISTDKLIIKENENKEEIKQPATDTQLENNQNQTQNPNNVSTDNSENNQNLAPDQTNNQNKEVYTISGNVWEDVNKDGIKNSNDSELKSIEVQLCQNNNTIQTTKTNGNGRYYFGNIENGKYTVVFTYDKEKYTATSYNKNVDGSTISTAIETEDGKAVSNEITVLNANIDNVNLGLQLKNQFNLSIYKYVTKAIVMEDSNKYESEFDNLKLAKVEISAKKLNKSSVDLEYKIVVENTGNVDGYATMINDYLPEEMKFDESKNNGWYIGNDGMLYNDTLKETIIKPGEKKELSLVLTKQMNENNTGTVSNKVLIAMSENKDGLQENSEDNGSTQEVLILIKTGYTIQIIAVITIMLILIILILNKDKLIKIKEISYNNKGNSGKRNIFKRRYK